MKRTLIAATLVLSLVVAVPTAQADSTFSITPVFQTINIDTQNGTKLSIDLTNSTPTDQSFQLSATDFGSLNESGGIAFLGAPTSELDHRYGLVSWLQLSQNVIFVPAGGTATIGVTVENRASLAPGGHYAAILATAITDTGAAKPPVAQVGLKAVLSSLILLTKSGGTQPDLKLTSEDAGHTGAKLPSTLDQRWQDAGNVHVVPRGVVEVHDPAGRVVKRGVLNEDSFIVLPESFRQIPVTLTSVGRAWMPGRYKIVTTYSYDGEAGTKTFTDSVWYAGAILVIIAWIIGLVVFGWFGWWLWRRWRSRRS